MTYQQQREAINKKYDAKIRSINKEAKKKETARQAEFAAILAIVNKY